MQPLDRSLWYVVAASPQVGCERVTLGMLFDQELAVWRGRSGVVQVWDNRCPHRSVRLTLGRVVDDELACRYHGWRYGRDGRCSTIPAHPGAAPPPAACVPTYAAQESGGLIWARLDDRPEAPPPPTPRGAVAYVRTYVYERPAEALRTSALRRGFDAGTPQVLSGRLAGRDAWLLLQPMGSRVCAAHLVCAGSGSAFPKREERVASNLAWKACLAAAARAETVDV